MKTYIGCSEKQAKWAGMNDPRNLLVIGAKYQVSSMIEHSFYTEVLLSCFPGKRFNSVCFQ